MYQKYFLNMITYIFCLYTCAHKHKNTHIQAKVSKPKWELVLVFLQVNSSTQSQVLRLDSELLTFWVILRVYSFFFSGWIFLLIIVNDYHNENNFTSSTSLSSKSYFSPTQITDKYFRAFLGVLRYKKEFCYVTSCL